ncbi:energy transducer TonB [Emticicia sp. BO119]|uniref:energy transducer TonB n=1 Tax=Emticicia sp. BO119 TaxID=2757768 RepID=UPI0015F073AB|nr:energy transducer TonB [Emticicia sp. BO119]MBA4851657.1 TonB family protein [Emticicia sp. BO119]
MAKKKQIFNTEHNALSAEDLKRYEAGEMTFQEMNRVERILLEQPFYADAVEGFSEIKKDQISTNKNLTDLKAKLRNRTNQTFTKPAPIFTIAKIWKPVSIAATLLLIFTGTYYLMDNKQNKADKAILMKNEAVEDNLSAPVANVPIAKEDNTATSNKGANVAYIEEKRKQALKNSTQAEAIVKESEELSVAKEAIASVIANPHEADKLATDTPSPTAGVASAPMAVEKKAVADRDEAIVQSRSIGGAGRLAGAAVSGTVVDEDNAPMKDVTVNIKGNANGIRTDEEGKFSLRDARRGDIIVFNSKVMPQMEIPFNNLPNKIVYSEHNINLPSKPKVPAGSINDSMFEKAATYAKPEFGWDAYEVYLNENTKRPPKALQMNIKGRVIVNFIINEKGELSDFTIIKSLGYGCDEEAIRLIKNGPKWFPATKEEKPVSSSKHVIVKFR